MKQRNPKAQKQTTWCSRKQESVSPDERTTGGVLVVPGPRSVDRFPAGRTPSVHLDAGGDAWAELCHLSDHCKLRCDFSDGSSAAAFVDCPYELCHLQFGAGTAAIPGLSQHRRLHFLA